MILLVVLGIAVLAVMAYRERETLQSGIATVTRLLQTSLPEWERQIIMDVAGARGVDPRFLAAVRIAERGGPGREYGVLSVDAPTYDDQVRVAANTISNTLTRYRINTGKEPVGYDGRYTEDFIQYFSHGGPGYPGYAPLGASNDPNDLNVNHARNVAFAYGQTDVIEV